VRSSSSTTTIRHSGIINATELEYVRAIGRQTATGGTTSLWAPLGDSSALPVDAGLYALNPTPLFSALEGAARRSTAASGFELADALGRLATAGALRALRANGALWCVVERPLTSPISAAQQLPARGAAAGGSALAVPTLALGCQLLLSTWPSVTRQRGGRAPALLPLRRLRRWRSLSTRRRRRRRRRRVRGRGWGQRHPLSNRSKCMAQPRRLPHARTRRRSQAGTRRRPQAGARPRTRLV
jgi:hypothetical protein